MAPSRTRRRALASPGVNNDVHSRSTSPISSRDGDLHCSPPLIAPDSPPTHSTIHDHLIASPSSSTIYSPPSSLPSHHSTHSDKSSRSDLALPSSEAPVTTPHPGSQDLRESLPSATRPPVTVDPTSGGNGGNGGEQGGDGGDAHCGNTITTLSFDNHSKHVNVHSSHIMVFSALFCIFCVGLSLWTPRACAPSAPSIGPH
ncbi:hypothetical protein SISNIDRAFT_483883 [Sistotremastrum niveocremeum HHB9708]|uniref:Uncharacterized protein n=1 Tax=Sistotremastrum niveocremeum HHB9708 TaxID=1314777 RepID=A0A164X5T2_9AGAM|nr:hypothetical protein SISNIDRAFT_483883 [Sistotremastrum niveocremeum HHB9708]